MKVALLSDCYLPRLGGIEVQVHDLARGLRAAGHHVEVITATAGGAPVDGIAVHRLSLSLLRGLPVNPLAPPQVRRLLRAGGFDVVHVHMGVLSPFAVAGVRVALGLGLPTVITWHCVLAGAEPWLAALGRVRRWSERGAVLTAVSALAAQPVARLAGAPVGVMPNGIDLNRWRPSSPDEHPRPAPAARVQVVTAMRLAARKRPHHLLRVLAAARALPGGSALDLTIFGEGPWRPVLERWIEQHEAHDWVHLPGRAGRDELATRYREADVYVSPTRLEAFGIAALEARTVGLPVVGPRVSGISEFVEHEVSGLLVHDDHELAQALARLAADPGLRQRLRAHNERRPPSQDWPSVIDHTVQVYRRAATRGPQPVPRL